MPAADQKIINPKLLRVRDAAYGVLRAGEFVLMCAGSTYGRKVVNFPGGAFQRGESAERALVREFAEEVGINVTIERLLHTSDDKVFVSPDIPNTRMVNRYFSVTAPRESIDLTRRAAEVDKLIWVRLSELPVRDMLEVDRAFVEVLRSRVEKL